MFSMTWNKLASALIACSVLSLAPLDAQAQILEEIQVQPDQYENAIRIEFNARIQLLRSVPVGKSNAIQVYFQLVQIDDPKLKKTRETLKSRAFEQLPSLTAIYIPETAQTQKLTLQIGKNIQPANVKIRMGTNSRSLLVVFGDKLKRQQTVSDDKRYALTLMSAADKNELSSKVIPREVQDYDIFTSQQTREGKIQHELNLGYFSTAEQAEKVRALLLAQFPDSTVTDLLKRRQARLDEASARAKPEAGQIQAQAPLPEVEDQANLLMPKAKEALLAANFELAINSFNQVLLLPPNKHSEEAQELVGLARERNGEIAKARAEYELYLKLFPDGAGVARVQRQLAGLKSPATIARKSKPKRDDTVTKTVSGSFSQFYYGGKSQTQTAFNTPVAPGTPTLSKFNQSELRTQIDLTGHYRNADSDQKLVFRDDDIRRFVDERPDRNRILSAYYEYKGYLNGFSAKIGRQTPTSAGVFGRFDGALLGYEFAPKWRANLVAGMPVDFPSLETDRKFWGVSLDANNLTERLSGKTYFTEQTADGIVDRRAVGMELGLHLARGSVSTLLDYDVSYDVVNIATLQGDWQTEGGSSYSFLLDRRRSPPLATSIALYNSAVTALSPIPLSIKQLLATDTEDQIRAWALASSAVTEQFTLGFQTPLNTSWQLGGDFNLVNTGALPGQTLDDGTVIPPQAETGNIYRYSLRAIGSSLLTVNDAHVFTVSLNQGETFHGEFLSYNNTTRLGRWLIEPSLKYYQQKTDPNTDTAQWSPEIHVAYQWKENLSLEADYTFQHVTTTNPTSQDIDKSHFFYLGYRWDI
ncbi:MAG: hypothetical protein ABL877_00025 [Thiobacillus sp.]